MADACFGRQEKTVYKPWIILWIQWIFFLDTNIVDILELIEECRMCKVGGNLEEYARRNKDSKQDIATHMLNGNIEKSYAKIWKKLGIRKKV